MDLLTVEHVTKQYAGHKALDDVSLAIPRGSVYGLLGPNGAGKTTLIRIINRITAPDSGRVLFGDREITPADVYRIGYPPISHGADGPAARKQTGPHDNVRPDYSAFRGAD